MPEARGLLLDIGGVILRNARELVLARSEREGGAIAAHVGADDVGGPDDSAWQAMLRHEITERQYWSDRAADLGRVLGHDAWSTRDLINWLYDAPPSVWLVQEMVELMADVKAAGLRLCALTNDMADFHGEEWVARQRWLDHFDVIVDASTTGVLKPHPDAYRGGIEAMGMPADEVVYLDDMPVNVRGALDAGLQAIEVMYADRAASIDEARRRLGLAA